MAGSRVQRKNVGSVIDVGSLYLCPETDQRGQTWPVDGDVDGKKACDIGAYEYLDKQKIVQPAPGVPLAQLTSDNGLQPPVQLFEEPVVIHINSPARCITRWLMVR